jgi:hypothetical protein
MKKTAIIIAVILVIAGGLLLARNIIAKSIISRGINGITGLSLEMNGLDIGIFKTVVEVKGLKLFNPSGYPDKLMVDMPSFYADYDLAAFLKGKVHFRELRINLQNLEVSKNIKGKTNLEYLQALQPKGSGPAPEVKIDKLVLDIGRVGYKDYSRPGKPLVKEFNLNIHQTYQNIDDPQSLVRIILAKALMNTSIGDLAKIDLSPLKKELGSVTGSYEQSAKGVKNMFKGLLQK